ncbi:MAG: hypothetical protein WA159_25415 [Variovorax sp.]
MSTNQLIHSAQLAREAIRRELLAAGMRSAQFDLEGRNGFVTSTRLLVADDSGVALQDQGLLNRAEACLSRWVDAVVPGWDADGGGRSRVTWSLDLDALDHAHYDNVNFERRRVLPGASGTSDSWILAENAVDATLLAMGPIAPTDAAARVRVMTALGVLTERERSDQLRFLTEAQRATLIEAICATRVSDHDEAWISDVVLHGYFGYLDAPDVEIVQKLATETLDQAIESMRGPSAGAAAAERVCDVRARLIEALTRPESLSALDAVTDEMGDQMLASLGREGLIDYRSADERSAGQVAS